MIMGADVYIVYRWRLTSKVYFYCSFFSFLFFFSFCLQQYATMDNSSLISYYNTQSELKVLTFGEIYYQSNNLTTRARSMFQFSFFYTRVCLIGYPLMVFLCCILLYCYIFCFMSSCENF
jgi:hypothetical protein